MTDRVDRSALDPMRIRETQRAVRRMRNLDKARYAGQFLRWLLHEGTRPIRPRGLSIIGAQAAWETVHSRLTGARPRERCSWAFCRLCRGESAADMNRLDPGPEDDR